MRYRKPVTEPAVKEDPKPVVVTRTSSPLDGVTLPPYSGDHPRCVKCNSVGATTRYMAEKSCCEHWGSPGGRYTHGQERQHRICRNCHWEWDEQCYRPEDKPHG